MIVRARTVRLVLPLAMAGLAGALLACKDEGSSGGSGGGASPSASPSTTVAAVTSASVSAAPPPPPPPPCTAAAAFVIDKGARLDTGLTSVEIENGKQVAVGYAVGDGSPRVAMVDATGAVTKADPDWSHVKDQEQKKDPTMVRHVFRVTPLGILKTGKMRVGMDFLDSFPTKGVGSYLRCGPADIEPVITDDGGAQFDDPTEDQVAKLAAGSDTDSAAVDFRDCRTFGNEKKSFVLATQVKREGPGDDHNLLYSWVIDEIPGKGMIKDFSVDKRVVKPTKDGKYPKIEHFVTPVAIPMGDLGMLITARDQGNIVFVKRTAKLEKSGEPKAMWLGAAAGMPALDIQNGQVYVMTTEFQKTDLYGVLFPATSTPEKPQKVELTDPNAPNDARDSASMDVTSTGDMAVAFVDGKAPARHARMTVLGPDLKQKLPTVFDVSPDGVNVSEARIVSLASGKFLVTYLQGDGQLSGQLVSCKY
jgi:hypothetical protein